MNTFLVILLVFIIIFAFTRLKIHVDLKSFFRKGFKKTDSAFGLYCYTGKQGKGKTYSCVRFLINQKLQHDYVIITNVKSFNVFSDTIYEPNFYNIIEISKQLIKEGKKPIIFFDEIFTLLEKGTRLNKDILSFLSQLRKRKIILVTTAQEWSEINITFRRYVRYQISCNMFALPIFKNAFVFNSINDGDGIRWNNDTQDFEAPRVSANFSKGNKCYIDSYDTFETIQTSK